jgi:hypothetical protein
MQLDDIVQLLLQLLHWLAISAGIGLPLIFCAYVLITPTHQLVVVWQNYRMRRQPHRALKDRHFKGLPRKIRWCKFICVFGFLIFLTLALEQFHVDVIALIENAAGK